MYSVDISAGFERLADGAEKRKRGTERKKTA